MMCDDAPPPPTFGMLDVRVGKIVEAWEHPDSDKLWVEKIDVGEVEVEGEGEEAKETPAPRQIASGLRAHYATAADLEGRAVIVVCNLKEAKLGGVPSNGMVLCASGDDGTVAFVEPPAGAAPGERIVVEGIMEDPASPNKVKKKKLMEKSAEELRAVSSEVKRAAGAEDSLRTNHPREAQAAAEVRGAALASRGPCRLTRAAG